MGGTANEGGGNKGEGKGKGKGERGQAGNGPRQGARMAELGHGGSAIGGWRAGAGTAWVAMDRRNGGN